MTVVRTEPVTLYRCSACWTVIAATDATALPAHAPCLAHRPHWEALAIQDTTGFPATAFVVKL